MTFTPFQPQQILGFFYQLRYNTTNLSESDRTAIVEGAITRLNQTRPHLVTWLACAYSAGTPLYVDFEMAIDGLFGDALSTRIQVRPTATHDACSLSDALTVAHLMEKQEEQMQALVIHELSHLPQRKALSRQHEIEMGKTCSEIPVTTQLSAKTFEGTTTIMPGELWCEGIALEAMRPDLCTPELKDALDAAENVALRWTPPPVAIQPTQP